MSGSKCPAGHPLPNLTPKGQCTGLYCAITTVSLENKEQTKKRKQKSAKIRTLETHNLVALANTPDSVVDGAISPEESVNANLLAKVERQVQLEDMAKQAGRFAARSTLTKVPLNLKGAGAEEWADAKLLELLPIAVAELEYQLKYGTPAQRADAAKEIREATGRGKRDGNGMGGGPVLILAGPLAVSPPWRSPKTPDVVDAVVESSVTVEEKKP